MNGKYPAKTRAGLAVVSLAGLTMTGWLAAASVSADFDDLSQQLRIQQHKSRFQLMLEQVQESARQRATTRTPSVERAGPSAPVGLGDWTESLRLDSATVSEPVPLGIAAKSKRRLRARQSYERKQRHILDQRQRRDALIAGSRTRGPAGTDNFSAKRRNLVRYRTENQRLTLQRKLRK